MGRELATLDELAQMQNGYCILFIARVGAFYSKLFDLKSHPNYDELYEPWLSNREKIYDHKKELEYNENSNYKLLCDSGLEYARPVEKITIENVNKNELKKLLKTEVIQYEDLKLNN